MLAGAGEGGEEIVNLDEVGLLMEPEARCAGRGAASYEGRLRVCWVWIG